MLPGCCGWQVRVCAEIGRIKQRTDSKGSGFSNLPDLFGNQFVRDHKSSLFLIHLKVPMTSLVILRVRTNVGTKRVAVAADLTLGALEQEVAQQLRIIGAPSVTLATDMSGQRVLSGYNESIQSLGLINGAELFALGKFEKVVIDRTTVTGQHEVQQAGEWLRLIEPVQIAPEPAPAPAPMPVPVPVAVPVPPVPVLPAALYEEEEPIRAPDLPQRATLLDHEESDEQMARRLAMGWQHAVPMATLDDLQERIDRFHRPLRLAQRGQREVREHREQVERGPAVRPVRAPRPAAPAPVAAAPGPVVPPSSRRTTALSLEQSAYKPFDSFRSSSSAPGPAGAGAVRQRPVPALAPIAGRGAVYVPSFGQQQPQVQAKRAPQQAHAPAVGKGPVRPERAAAGAPKGRGRKKTQEEQDAELARQLQEQLEQEDEEEQNPWPEPQQAAPQQQLREHLQYDRPLPRSLAAEVNRSAEDDLLHLAIVHSLEHEQGGAGGGRRMEQEMEQEVLPEYDEEDELLARALQESLNAEY